MATIMNDAAYMGFPLSIKRGNPAPVDTTAVWYSKTELEEYQRLKDKETPKTLVRYNHSNEWHCPTCGSGNGEYEGTVGAHNYCHYCGQKLDWR